MKKAVTDEEKKKWYVDRIETQLNNAVDESSLRREQFKSHADRIQSNLTSWRNTILAGVTFGATIVLGLSSISMFKDWVIPLLSADILIGITTFVVLSTIKQRVYQKLSSIDSSFLLARGKLDFLKAQIVSKTLYIDELNITILEYFRRYCIFADGAAKVDMLKSFDNALKSYFLQNERTILQEGSRSAKQVMDIARQVYIRENNFDFIKEDFPYLGFVHDDFLRYYGMK